jgi:hypothetical protein
MQTHAPHGTHPEREGKSRCQYFGAGFEGPHFARALARITRAGAGAHGRANFSAMIQTATKYHCLTNFLVWLVLVVIQTDPELPCQKKGNKPQRWGIYSNKVCIYRKKHRREKF